MSGDYVRQCLRAALIRHQGHLGKAQKALLQQTRSDHELLRELTAPYLRGILEHTVQELAGHLGRKMPEEAFQALHSVDLARAGDGDPAEAPPVDTPPQELDADMLDSILGQMAQNEPATPATESPRPGPLQAALGKARSPSPRSPHQARMMHKLAEAFKKRRNSGDSGTS